MISPLCMPPELVRDRIVPLLDLKSCVCLDSAVLSKSLRSNWLDGLRSALLLDQHLSVENDGLSWIRKRKLRLNHAELLGSLSDFDVTGCGEVLLSELTTLSVNSCQNITDIGVAFILQSSSKLHRLSIDHCYQISPLALRDVRPKALKELSFMDCTSLDDATFTELVVNCPNLEVVNITGCDKLTDVSVRTLACICTKLKEIQFRIEGSMTMQSVHYLAWYCAELKKIVDTFVFDSMINEDYDVMHDEVLIELAQKCPLLEHVEVQAPYFSNQHLLLFSRNCPNLRTFAFGVNERIDHEGVEALVTNCPSLTHLNLSYLSNCKDLGLTSIAAHCTGLTTLKLSDLYNPSPSLLTSIWSANPNLHTLALEAFQVVNPMPLDLPAIGNTALTHLDLSETNLSKTSLLDLFPCCPLLQYLNLTLTHNMSPDVFSSLGRHCPLLHTLIATHCTRVDTESLLALAEHCTSLTTLKLGSTKSGDEGLSAIIAQNKKLEFLDLSWCSKMTDATMYALAKSCANLHTLKLKHAKISDTAFSHVVQRCRQLRKVSLQGCSFITLECITLLAQHNRKLQDFSVSSSAHLTDTIFRVLSQYCPCLRRLEVSQCVNVLGLVAGDMMQQYKGQLFCAW